MSCLKAVKRSVQDLVEGCLAAALSGNHVEHDAWHHCQAQLLGMLCHMTLRKYSGQSSVETKKPCPVPSTWSQLVMSWKALA